MLQVSFLTTNPSEGYNSNSLLKLTYVAQTEPSVCRKLLRKSCWVSLAYCSLTLFFKLEHNFWQCLQWNTDTKAELKPTAQPLKDKSSERILRGQLLEQQNSALLVKHYQHLYNSAILFPKDANYRFYTVKQALLPGVTKAPLSPSESKTRNAKCCCHE